VHTIAFVREPSAAIQNFELTHIERLPIDVDRARAQHAHYAAVLNELGARSEWLPPLPALADGVFVEDTALVLPEIAVLTRPGAESRQPEVASVEEALAAFGQLARPLYRILAPACLDGGDVLRIGHRILVGVSSRSNEAGASQLREAVEAYGYEVSAVEVHGCLHLKSACTALSAEVVLANLDYISREALGDVTVIAVDPEEPRAANTLTLGGVTLVSVSYPRTEARLRAAGIQTRSIDVSELEKAESGLTCMSLVVAAN
jgi:dimethylargininase